MISVLCMGITFASDIDDLQMNDGGNDILSVDQTDGELAMTNDGSDDVLGDNLGTFTELQSIIDGNESGATITLDKNYLFSDVVKGYDQMGVLIDKPLTIDGAGFYIDGNNFSRIFNITSSGVTLKNITIKGGNFTYYSVDSQVSNARKHPCFGGAIHIAENLENFRFENVNFEENNIFADPNWRGGTRYTGYGGAIYFSNNVKNVTFDSCNFTNNVVYGGVVHGAALYFVGSARDVLFKDSFFNNNSIHHDTGTSGDVYASGTGAAVYMGPNSYNVTFKNGIIFNNNVLNINRYPPRDGYYTDDAIYIGKNSTAVIENFDLSHSGFQNYGNLTVKNVNFTNKSSISNAGSLIVDTAVFKDGTDQESKGGGAIYMSGGTAVIRNAEFINNIAVTLGQNYQFSRHAYSGGAIYVGSGILEVYNSSFKDNFALNNGGAIYSKGNTSIYNSSFEGNWLSYGGWEATGYGGAVYLGGNTNVVSDCNFTNNYVVYGSGGAIFADGNAVNNTIENCNFINNNVTYFEYNPMYEYHRYLSTGDGGAVCFSKGNNTISNSYFENNTAHRGSAAAIVDYSYSGEVSNLSVSNSSFLRNKLDALTVELDVFNAKMIAYVTLISGNTQMEAIYSRYDSVEYDNVTYVDASGSHNTRIDVPIHNQFVSSQEVILEVWDGDELIRNVTKTTDENGSAVFDDLNLENNNYAIKAYHPENEYYVYGESNGNFRKIGDFDKLQELVERTETNGVLELDCDFTYDLELDTIIGGIYIHRNITILGNGHTINALNKSRIFLISYDGYWNDETGEYIVSPVEVTLKGLNVVNGTAFAVQNGQFGGAIVVDANVTLSIDECSFINNTASNGSAIFHMGNETLNITNSSFKDNKLDAVQIEVSYDYASNEVLVLLEGNNMQIDAIFSVNDIVEFSNVQYQTDNGMLNTDENPSEFSRFIAFQNVTIEIYDNESRLVKNITNLTNEEGIAAFKDLDLDYGNYTIIAYHINNTQYPYADNEMPLSLVKMGDFDYLQMLVNLTPENGVLELTRNFTYDLEWDTIVDGIVIDKNITIIGNGHTIDALNQSRIFLIADSSGSTSLPCDVTLKNITFANGVDSNTQLDINFGGAIVAFINSIDIEDCVFVNNSVMGYGGALGIVNTTTIINNSTFLNNNGTYAGVIFLEMCYDFMVNGSDFINNSAMFGGAIFGFESYNFTVTESNFINNNASMFAGAIIIEEFEHILLESCNFINNSVSSNASDQYLGGAVAFAEGYDLIVNNCNFTNNTLDATGNSNNVSIGGGAVLIMVVFNTTINQSNFDNNGIIYGDGGIAQATSDMPEVNGGGAIYAINMVQEFCNFTVIGSNFTNNSAAIGSAIYVGNGFNLTLVDSTFLENCANVSSFTMDVNEEELLVYAAFEGYDNYINAVYVEDVNLIFDNVQYWSTNGIVNSDDVTPINSTFEAGQVIIFEISDENDNIVKTVVAVTDLDGIAKVSYADLENKLYKIRAYHADEKYYMGAEDIFGEIPIANIGDFERLQIWIETTENGGIINLTRNFTYDLELDTIKDGIMIEDKNITIVGNGYVIDALEMSRIFNIDNSNVKLENMSLVNGTSFNDDLNASALYIKESDVTADNVIFANNAKDNSIYVESGRLEINDSLLYDSNSIYNAGDAYLNDVVELNEAGDYAVLNDGNLSLKKNKFKNPIKNNGLILTSTNVTVLDNRTISPTTASIELVARVLDDNNNIIELNEFKLLINDEEAESSFNGTDYVHDYTFNHGYYIVSASVDGLENNELYYAIIDYRLEPVIELTFEQINEGEKVIINATISPEVEGNITLMVNNIEYECKIINGVATLPLENLEVGKYNVLATFPGSSSAKNATANDSFIVKLRPTIIPITVENGDKAIIKANLTAGATGEIKFIVDGKEYTLNVGEDLEIDAFAPGNHTVIAIYEGDDLYAPSNNNTVYEMDKLTSLVKVSAKDIVYGNDALITVELPEAQSGTVTIKINDKTYTKEISGGKAEFTVSNLAVNTYPIEVTYSGDDVYDSNVNTSSFKVTKADLDADVNALDVTTSQNTSFVIDVPDDFTGKVKITVDGLTYDGDADALIQMANLTEGDKKATVTFYGDKNYKHLTLTDDFKVTEEVKPVVKNESSIKVDVKDGKIIAAVDDGVEGNVTFIVNGKEYSKEIKNGEAILEDVLTVGNNSIVAYYPENDNYASSIDSTVYEMDKLTSSVKVSAKDIVYGNDAVIVVEVPEAQSGTVTISVDGKSYTKKLENGKAEFAVSGLVVKNYPISVTYNGDDVYDVNDNASSFKVTKADLDAEVKAVDVTTSQNTSFAIDVPDDFTGKVKITVDELTYDGDVSELIQMANLTEGDKKATVTFYGDPNYKDLTLTADFKVSEDAVPVDKKDSDMSIDVSDDTVTVNVADDATGNVTVSVNGKKYSVPIKDGKAVLSDVELNEGNNTIIAIYDGDDNYNGGFADKTIEIQSNSSVVISVENVTKYFSGPERFVVKIAYENGTPVPGVEVLVKIKINGVEYERATNKQGIASLALNLNSGNYTAEVIVEEYNFTSTNSIEILPTIYADDVVKMFRNGTQYWGLFLDGEGNPLANTTVTFNIHGVFYNRTTNATGWAKLNIGIEKGQYIITALNTVTGEMKSNNITVFTLIESGDLVKYYRNDSQFVVRIVGDNGSYAGAGERVDFNIHGMLYTRYTNATGHAVLNINIEPGNYTITTYYKDCREGNSIIVLPVLSASNLTMKYRDGSRFEAKLVDGQGKPYSGQTVTFNINGVFYNRTTDSNGIARLNINLMAGEYIITSEYESAKISNTIKING